MKEPNLEVLGFFKFLGQTIHSSDNVKKKMKIVCVTDAYI